MPWRDRLNAFECYGCGEFTQLSSRRQRDDPEYRLMMWELLIVDHTECWEFDDPEMALQARKHRKRKKLLANLAAQNVSWRGR
jgi:hypothetical protein